MHYKAFLADATRTEGDKIIIFGAVQTKGGQDWLVETECGKVWLGLVTDGRAGIGKVRARASENRSVTKEYGSDAIVRLPAESRFN